MKTCLKDLASPDERGNTMTALEKKILDALKAHMEWMASYDSNRKAEYDDYMQQAEAQEINYWKKDLQHRAEFQLSKQKHGYDFLTTWKNIISNAMYGRTYYEWHPAQAGKYKGTGHGAFATSELTDAEQEIIEKVFDGIVKRGYLKLSKSGKMATFKG